MVQLEPCRLVLRINYYIHLTRLLEVLASFGLVTTPYVILAQVEVSLGGSQFSLVAALTLEQLEHFLR